MLWYNLLEVWTFGCAYWLRKCGKRERVNAWILLIGLTSLYEIVHFIYTCVCVYEFIIELNYQ